MIAKPLRYFLLISTLILIIPLIAMQFSTEVNWSLFDFLIGGILLYGLSFLMHFLLNRFRTSKYKWLLVILVLFAFFLLWAEMAVGIFGSPIAGS